MLPDLGNKNEQITYTSNEWYLNVDSYPVTFTSVLLTGSINFLNRNSVFLYLDTSTFENKTKTCTLQVLQNEKSIEKSALAFFLGCTIHMGNVRHARPVGVMLRASSSTWF